MERYVKNKFDKQYKISFYYKGLILLGICALIALGLLIYFMLYMMKIRYYYLPAITSSSAFLYSENSDGETGEIKTLFYYQGCTGNSKESIVPSSKNDSFGSVHQKLIINSPFISVSYFKVPVYVRAKIIMLKNGTEISCDQVNYLMTKYCTQNGTCWKLNSNDGYLYLVECNYDKANDGEMALNMQKHLGTQVRLLDYSNNEVDNPAYNNNNDKYQLIAVFEYTTDLNKWRK